MWICTVHLKLKLQFFFRSEFDLQRANLVNSTGRATIGTNKTILNVLHTNIHERSNDVDHFKEEKKSEWLTFSRRLGKIALQLSITVGHNEKYRWGEWKAQNNIDKKKRQLKRRKATTARNCCIQTLWSNVHFNVFVALIINGANTKAIRSTCLRTVCF